MSLAAQIRATIRLKCNSCLEEHPVLCFPMLPGDHIRSGTCADCVQPAPEQESDPGPQIAMARFRAKEWAKAHPDRVKSNGREWRTRLLNGALKKLGGRCACCGETERRFLQIDHVNGDGNRDRVRRSPQAFYRHVMENEEPGVRLRLLCANCHFAHSYRSGCPHELARVAEAALSA